MVEVIQQVSDECFSCNICVRECAFLQEHGTPGELFSKFLQGHHQEKEMVYGCNLCGLCSSVCPKKLEVSDAFLQMRRSQFRISNKVLPQHSTICNYEKRGHSSLFSLHHIPSDCDTVFFPGCTLAATRSETTLKCYNHLKTLDSSMGIVLDCCFKPSHDLGRESFFSQKFDALINDLIVRGVTKVITGCPSCLVTFRRYGVGVDAVSLYEVLRGNPPVTGELKETVSIHDTCVTRFDAGLQDSVRDLVLSMGGDVEEMKHSRDRAVCCGEGGAASFVAPHITDEWKTVRKSELAGDRLITYCAGCASTLSKDVVNTHLLDLLFDFKRARKGAEKKSKAPITYLKRLWLKWRIQRSF